MEQELETMLVTLEETEQKTETAPEEVQTETKAGKAVKAPKKDEFRPNLITFVKTNTEHGQQDKTQERPRKAKKRPERYRDRPLRQTPI